MADISGNVEYIMREKIEPTLPATYNEVQSLGAKVQGGKSLEVSTRTYRIPLEVAIGGETGYVNFDGGANMAGTRSFKDLATGSTVGLAHARQITCLAQYATDTQEKAIEADLAHEVALAMKGLKIQEDQYLQIGPSSVLATISGAGSAPTYSVKETDGSNPFGASLLSEGNKYDIYDYLLTSLRANGPYQIVGKGGIDLFNQNVTFTASITAGVATDVIVAEGGLNAGLQGLPYLVKTSTATWQGVTGTLPYTKATGVDANWSTLQLPMFYLLKGQIIYRKGEDKIPSLTPYMNSSMEQAYIELAQPSIIINMGSSGSQNADPLFGSTSMFGKKPMINAHADPNKIYFLDFSAFRRAEVHPMSFKTDSKGNRMFPVYGANYVPSNADWFQVEHQWQLACVDPTNMGVLANVQTPAGYVGYKST